MSMLGHLFQPGCFWWPHIAQGPKFKIPIIRSFAPRPTEVPSNLVSEPEGFKTVDVVFTSSGI